MEVQKTINYFQFKHIDSNRPVDPRHVKELAEKIKTKDMLHLFPVLVNANMEIIDGQHRLAAAEQLGVYIYYQIDNNISKSDIASVNSLAKNWSLLDYINYWTIEQKEGFDKLSEFIINNPLISASTCVTLMAKDGSRGIKSVREGNLDISNYDRALEIARVLAEYNTITKFAYERFFILAVIKLLRTPGYLHSKMQEQLEYQSRSLVKCANTQQYTEMLFEIYNHKLGKNRITIA